VNIPRGYKPLVVFGCVHVGHKDADLDMAHRYVNWVKKHDAYALLLADNHECALPHKGHMMFEQNLTPQEQLDYGINLFAPIAKNIVGACTGNHAARAQKVAGVDFDKIMADRLGYSKNYRAWDGLVSAKVGKIEYKIAFMHGREVGANTFGNCLNLMRKYPSADICATSHTHRIAHASDAFWDVQGSIRRAHPVEWISTGSLLNFPRYADEAGYRPQKKGFAVAFLSGDRRDVQVDTSGVI
jgi:predicted phosphodiesterase